MSASDRLRGRGIRRANRLRLDLGTELLHARMAAGMSQRDAGTAAGISADKVWRIENNRAPTLSLRDAAQLGAVLGFDLSARFYPTGVRIRDAAQARLLASFLDHVGAPLRYRTDVPLPQKPGQPRELRAWDAVIWHGATRTAIELEARVTDLQEMIRRHALKRRDDPVDLFLLIVADTAHNRRVLAEFGGLFPDLPRLRTANVLSLLNLGRHPATGYVLFRAPPASRPDSAPHARTAGISSGLPPAEPALPRYPASRAADEGK